MLKTNSKKARENIRAYIMEHYDPSGYDVNQSAAAFPEIASIILETYRIEKRYSRNAGTTEGFIDWCQGLPSIIDTCYFYNRSAVDDLGEILEETDDEKRDFDEYVAGRILSILIYRELLKGEREHENKNS